jgi:hypothetical protein
MSNNLQKYKNIVLFIICTGLIFMPVLECARNLSNKKELKYKYKWIFK